MFMAFEFWLKNNGKSRIQKRVPKLNWFGKQPLVHRPQTTSGGVSHGWGHFTGTMMS